MAPLRLRYTLLVPTFNRPAHLRSLLGYLAARRFQYPVRVLDSSSGDALTQNRETASRGALDSPRGLRPRDSDPQENRACRGLSRLDLLIALRRRRRSGHR
jgi:hypothetical protein